MEIKKGEVKMDFKLGQVVMTRGVNDTIADSSKFAKEVTEAFKKYCSCNWGDTCEEDAQMNDAAVRNDDDRVVAKYETCEGDIFIITEWDRSYTTILFPSEY